MAKSTSKLSEEQIKEIYKRVGKESDKKIARDMGLHFQTVRKYRLKIGVEAFDAAETTTEKIIMAQRTGHLDMTEEERRDFFSREFKNPHDYELLKEQFSIKEINFYIQEWLSYRTQFDDLFSTESRQIDELIKSQIMSNRILIHIQRLENQITQTLKDIDLLRKSTDIADDEAAQEKEEKMGSLVRMMNATINLMQKDYSRFTETKSKILDDLSGKRKERHDILSKGQTFQDIVRRFLDEGIREKEGREMGLIKAAKDQKAKDFRKPIRFDDGEIDSILVDSKTNAPPIDRYDDDGLTNKDN